MKNKNKLVILAIVVLICIGFITYYILNRNESDTTLSILDKKWIEINKDLIIDIAVLNNLPIYGYEGNGIFFEFINSLENDTGLEFNKVPYSIGTNPSLGEYVYKILGTNANVESNQLLIYEDFYVALSKSSKKIDKISDVNGYNVGVLQDDISFVSYYLTSNNNPTFKSYENSEGLFEALNLNEVNLVVVPYNLYLNEILITNDYHIVFHLNEVSKKYVLQLSDKNDRLNSIMRKYYTKWLKDDYHNLYNKFLLELYLLKRNVDSVIKNEFKGKRYTYGLVNNLPYEMIINDKLVGINGEYINVFSNITGVEFKFVGYKNLEELNKAILDGDVDIAFNYYNVPTSIEVDKTMSPYYEEYVLIAHNSKNFVVNSLKSMQNNTINVLKNTFISDHIKEYQNINVVEFETVDKLLKNINKDSILLIDSNTYNYSKNSKFTDFKVLYRNKLNQDYTFILNNIEDNKTLIDLYKKFVASIDYKIILNNANIKLMEDPVRQNLLQIISRYILVIIIIMFLFVKFTFGMFTKQKKKKQLKKEEKLKYTDMLTSLKNRNYLNDNIEKWEESKVFPQTIIIVDLNNVKYVNDNYGHEEGDNLIKKAASILINTQLENSEIIRTDGNEFLIYLVGYTEQQIVSYTRKLYKEFKNLPHEFGAALGVSMIEDEIKTIDDAINEATLDMRTNKEGIKNN